MSEHELSPEEVDALLAEHAHQHAERAVARLGGPLCVDNLDAFLGDNACLRWPTSIVFDDAPLEAHQFAQPVIDGPDHARTCTLYVHPRYRAHPEALPCFVAYFAAVINYGIAAGPALCESVGAALTQQSPDAFYDSLLAWVD